jgi:hypothetical protein
LKRATRGEREKRERERRRVRKVRERKDSKRKRRRGVNDEERGVGTMYCIRENLQSQLLIMQQKKGRNCKLNE